jgi:hypothetical protein
MYELYDECTIMFFFRNKHIMVDLGTGNNNKVRSLGWCLLDVRCRHVLRLCASVSQSVRWGLVWVWACVWSAGAGDGFGFGYVCV